MESQLFIPQKMRVGFQKRDDTFTGKLAYLVYFDAKGVLRKEKSWEGWRDKKIPAQDFDNSPQSGLVLNKDIKRYNWSHFSSNRTLIRVHDPRGFEFEITTENLIGILMNTDCSKRALQGEFVYAYSGPELVLLPTCSEEYEKAVNFTKLQGQKISAKTLILGASYKSKREGDYVYVGRFFWYEMSIYGNRAKQTRSGKKYHIFTQDDGESFITKSSVDFLAVQNTEAAVSNYADIIEKFQANTHSSKIVKWEVVPCEFDTTQNKTSSYGSQTLKKSYYYTLKDNKLSEYHINIVSQYNHTSKNYELKGYSYHSPSVIDIETQTLIDNQGYRSSYYNQPTYSENNIRDLKLGDLTVTLENGKKIKVMTQDQWSSSLFSI